MPVGMNNSCKLMVANDVIIIRVKKWQNIMEVYSIAPVSDKTSTLIFIIYYIIVQMGKRS